MQIKELLDLTLREVLENYVALHNLECGYYYGIASVRDIDKLFDEYNIEEDYPEAFNVENLINDELIISFDDEIKEYDGLVRIMENLGITKNGHE